MTPPTTNPHFHGLRTVLYHAPDLDKAKAWYSRILGIDPYFDQPFYVGFSVGGYELGLDPDASTTPGGSGGVVVYWGVSDAQAALARLLSLGQRSVRVFRMLATVSELPQCSTPSATFSASFRIRTFDFHGHDAAVQAFQ